jgi:hypothetical protein
MNSRAANTLMNLYGLVAFGTFAFLTFFDHYSYTAWNWLLVVPINFLLGAIWPIYWLILRPLS